MHPIKYLFSLFIAFFCLPLVLIMALFIYLYDRHNPFYCAPRTGKDGKLFNMIKLRSMVINAHLYKIDSTATDDPRITPVGKWVRRFKIDELTQIINVVKGDMNLVGPRPQVKIEVDRYTAVEKGILKAKPGITDLASIVFSDEGDILEGAENPDLLYAQIERPWKSRLALLYVKKQSLYLDLKIMFFTFTNIFARRWTLNHIYKIVQSLQPDDSLLLRMVSRSEPLLAYPPPGSNEIIQKL